MLYAFEANGEGEITVLGGREVVVLEPDSMFSPSFFFPFPPSATTFMYSAGVRANPSTAGSGWVKIRAGYKEGLVPATYIEVSAAPAIATHNTGQSARPSSTYSNSGSSVGTTAAPQVKKKGPAVAPRRGAKKLRYVEALYDYSAQNETEHSMAGGERFVLIKEDNRRRLGRGGEGRRHEERAGQLRPGCLGRPDPAAVTGGRGLPGRTRSNRVVRALAELALAWACRGRRGYWIPRMPRWDGDKHIIRF